MLIPKKRIAEFKRKNGALQREIEKRCGVKIKLVESEDELEINAVDETQAGNEWIAEQVCRAIALGFDSHRAFKLCGDDYFLEEIDLAQSVRGSPKALHRYKARIIGENGKVKHNIEEFTGAFLAISDEKVAFLGAFEEIKLAKDAVFKILEGKEISTVYTFLEKYAKKTL